MERHPLHCNGILSMAVRKKYSWKSDSDTIVAPEKVGGLRICF